MQWVENHGTLCPIWTGMAFLPICECVLPVFLSEFRQNVHGIDTKVDHDGIGIGLVEFQMRPQNQRSVVPFVWLVPEKGSQKFVYI